MADVKSFKDLIVWQKAMHLVERCYEITSKLPRHELYALGDQIRRSSVSIPSNIAEGSKRHNTKEFHQFCGIALGSSAELETQLLLVARLNPVIEVDSVIELLNEIQRMLTKLCQKLKSKQGS